MGKWVTINGTHVYIEKGQSVEDALSKLSDKPKREKTYVAKHWYHGSVTVPESNLHFYNKDDYEISEIHLDKELDFIDNMDLNASIPELEKKLFNETAGLPQHIRTYLKGKLSERIAEHQMELADKFLEKIPQHEDISVEESLLAINQDHYKWSKEQDSHSPDYAAYTYNCQRCAQAFILRYCYGYDVTARPAQKSWNPKTKEFDDINDNVKLDEYAIKNGYDRNLAGLKTSGNYNGWDRVIFNRSDVRRTLEDGDEIAKNVGYSGTEDQLRYIKKKVKESGDGSAWLCSVCWKGTRDYNGHYSAHIFCIINDGGKVKFIDPQNGRECSEYFTEKQIVPKKTEIFRADNCRLNGTMMKEVVTYDESI